ncbi:10507_t:CDS:2, partial [Racocetra fulgida]
PDVIKYRNPYVQNYFVAKVGTIIFNKDIENLNIELPQPLKNVKNASAFRVILPWFDALNIMLGKISKAYEDAEYNRKTCRILTDRADDVLTAVKILFRRRDEEVDKFLDDYYVKSFIKLHRVLRDIKEFISNVSQLKGLSKFVSAEDIRKRCIVLINELESSCVDLNLNTTISAEDKRLVQKSLMEDVDAMNEIINIDEQEYIKYLKKSAVNGNPTALFYYGILSLDGKYVEKDEKIGMQCLLLAIAKGQKQAIVELKNRNIDVW